MRAHATALLVAIAMMVPSGALASAMCDGEAMVKDACCCDDAVADDGADSIDGACCCELERPLGHSEAHDVLAPAPSDERAPAAAALTWVSIDDRPAPSATVVIRSRGPPPDPTLVGQHILLLC